MRAACWAGPLTHYCLQHIHVDQASGLLDYTCTSEEYLKPEMQYSRQITYSGAYKMVCLWFTIQYLWLILSDTVTKIRPKSLLFLPSGHAGRFQFLYKTNKIQTCHPWELLHQLKCPLPSRDFANSRRLVAAVNRVQHSFLVYRFPGCCLSGLIWGEDAGLSNLFIFSSFRMATNQPTHIGILCGNSLGRNLHTRDSHLFYRVGKGTQIHFQCVRTA